MSAYINVLRPWQWIKNLLIFIPYILSENSTDSDISNLIIIFFTFSVFVSSTYVFNDIKDVDIDRIHPKKKNRPIANGTIEKKRALIYSTSLFLSSLAFSFYINTEAGILFTLYGITTFLYSTYFKYLFVIDTFSISFMFLIRLLIGGSVSSISVTIYLASFIFLTSCILSISKKLSIINTENINFENTFFAMLKKQDNNQAFKYLYFFFSILSLSSVFLWFIDLRSDILFFQNIVFLIISMISYFIFLTIVFKLSNKGRLEDFSKEVIANKDLLITAIFIVVFFSLGYF
tara:strand:- start:4699 stop:5568 length:870 start_codon:yes stop_codon:yes gene_type:complete